VTPAQICALPGSKLAAAMAAGRAFDPAALGSSTYRGTSLGLPRWLERLTWKRFAKTFVGARGYNTRIEQTGAWRPMLRRGAPITFGHFAVVVERGVVVLDYSGERGPLGALRDPLVALDDRADLLLGRSLLAVAGRAIPTPSYFLLEREVTVAAGGAGAPT